METQNKIFVASIYRYHYTAIFLKICYKNMDLFRHILNLYELWKGYEEKREIASILQKMPKPKTQAPWKAKLKEVPNFLVFYQSATGILVSGICW